MPEGDTIHRAARALHAALAGQRVERFESVFAHLTRVDADQPIAGRLVQRVEARGKHILMWLDDDQGGASLVLRTHMRMHGSWHIYQPGERWQRPRHELRILLETQPYVAVAFAVPVAEFVPAGTIDREGVVAELGRICCRTRSMRTKRAPGSPPARTWTWPTPCSTSARWRASATSSSRKCCLPRA